MDAEPAHSIPHCLLSLYQCTGQGKGRRMQRACTGTPVQHEWTVRGESQLESEPAHSFSHSTRVTSQEAWRRRAEHAASVYGYSGTL